MCPAPAHLATRWHAPSAARAITPWSSSTKRIWRWRRPQSMSRSRHALGVNSGEDGVHPGEGGPAPAGRSSPSGVASEVDEDASPAARRRGAWGGEGRTEKRREDETATAVRAREEAAAAKRATRRAWRQ